MPGEDRMGPEGEGPRTGRGMGSCGSDKSAPDEPTTWPRFGMGRGGGRGGGSRYRNRFRATGHPAWLRGWMGSSDRGTQPSGSVPPVRYTDQELTRLKQQVAKLEQDLKELASGSRTGEEPWAAGTPSSAKEEK
jgi:hypothetical protein